MGLPLLRQGHAVSRYLLGCCISGMAIGHGLAHPLSWLLLGLGVVLVVAGLRPDDSDWDDGE